MPRKKENSVLKDNWWLILVVVALVSVGAITAFMSGGSDEPEQTGVIGSAGDGVDIVRLGDAELEDRETTDRYQGLTQEQKDARYIEEYEAEIAADPDGPEAAETMTKLSVVYRRQGRFAEASVVLEDILEKFPGTPNARTAMIWLPEVYEAANDIPMARQSYERMIEYFPPESEEHKWAKQRYEEL